MANQLLQKKTEINFYINIYFAKIIFYNYI